VTLREATDQLQQIASALQATYPGAFATLTPDSKSPAPRFGWEVRIAAGTRALEKATAQLRSAVAEAYPVQLTEEVKK